MNLNPFTHKKFFNPEQEALIINAIKEAERNTSGEIKVHIESQCKGDVFVRGLQIFKELGLYKTRLKNGVLFYLATTPREFAIVADEGINKVVPENFWENIKNEMSQTFKNEQFTEGLTKGILQAGEQLKSHFPYRVDDKNEISDEISEGE